MVEFDLQNTFVEEQTESELYKLFAHVSLTRDTRAKRDMVPNEVWGNLPPDPEIFALEQRRAMLKQGRYRIKDLQDEEEIRKLTEQIRLRQGRSEYSIARSALKQLRAAFSRSPIAGSSATITSLRGSGLSKHEMQKLYGWTLNAAISGEGAYDDLLLNLNFAI